MRACAAGFRVLYRTSAKLLTDLNASLARKTLPARLRRYHRPEFLIIDEFAFDKVERLESPHAAHLLYKVIVARHRRRSTALLTNIDFDGLADYLGDAPLAMALLDRLVDGAIIIKIKGKSYRASKAKTAKSLRKPKPLNQLARWGPCFLQTRCPDRNRLRGPVYPAKMAQFLAAIVT
jgi:DNA replication protein DnaC